MSAFISTDSSTLFAPGLQVIQPRRPSGRLVLHQLGAGASNGVIDLAVWTNKVRLINALVDNGYTVISGAFGGLQNWGNDFSQRDVAAAIAWAGTALGLRTDKLALWGESMGFMSLARYAASFPSTISCLIGTIPAADAQATYTANPLGLAANMDDAYRPALVRRITGVKADTGVTTVDLVLTGMTVGNYLVVRTAADNAGTNGAPSTVTVTNQSGTPIDTATDQAFQANVDPGAASVGSTANLIVGKITAASGTVRITYGNTVVQSAEAEEWTGMHGTTPIVGTPVTGTGTASTNLASVADASIAVGNVAYGVISAEGPDSDVYTNDADSTNGTWTALTKSGTTAATATNNQTVYGGYKRVTAAGAQTYNPTIGTARDSAGIIAEFGRASWANVASVRDPSQTAIYSALDPFPVWMGYASDDGIVSGASALATLIGANGTAYNMGTGGHSDAPLATVTNDQLVGVVTAGSW